MIQVLQLPQEVKISFFDFLQIKQVEDILGSKAACLTRIFKESVGAFD